MCMWRCKTWKYGSKRISLSFGDIFLNGVETSQAEAAFLLLLLPMIYMTRGATFINTSPPYERTFLVKKMEDLKKIYPHSTKIQTNNLINHYKNKPKMFLNYTLADFAAKLNIVYPKGFADDVSTNDMDNDLPCNEDGEDNDQSVILLHCQMVSFLKKHQKARIIQYVNYSIKKDPENYYRERLMLFYPWKNESVDLIVGSKSYEDSYKKKQNKLK